MTPVVLFVGLLFAPHLADIREHPQYKTWAITLQDGPDAARAQVVQALHPFGPRALPLLAALRVALQRAEEFATVEALAEQLARLGPDAKEAIPDLLRHLRQGTGHCYTLTRTIAAVGDPGNREALERCVTHQRSWVDTTLDNFGPIRVENKDCPLPDLIRQYPNQVLPVLFSFDIANNAKIRKCVVGGLAGTIHAIQTWDPLIQQEPVSQFQLAPKVKRLLVATLCKYCDDEDQQTRNNAMYVLAIIEPPACVAHFASFLAAQARYHDAVRIEIGPDAIAALNLKSVFEALRDPSQAVYYEAHSMLEAYLQSDGDLTRDPHRRAVPRVATGLHHPSAEVRLGVLGVFWLPPFAEERRRVDFTPLLRDPDPRVRLSLAEHYARSSTDPTPPNLVAVVQELARGGPVEQRVLAIQVLHKLGPKARAAEALLLRLVRNPNVQIRVNAAFALRAIVPKNPTFNVVFEEALVNADDATFDVWQEHWRVLCASPSAGLLMKYRHGKPSERLQALLTPLKDF